MRAALAAFTTLKSVTNFLHGAVLFAGTLCVIVGRTSIAKQLLTAGSLFWSLQEESLLLDLFLIPFCSVFHANLSDTFFHF